MKISTWLAIIVIAAGLDGPVAAPPVEAQAFEPDLLDVKFREGAKVRLRDDRPVELSNQDAVRLDLQGLQSAFAGGTWSRTHSADERVLDSLRTKRQANSAKPLPDLNNYFRLRLPHGLAATNAKKIIKRYPSVEGAYLRLFW